MPGQSQLSYVTVGREFTSIPHLNGTYLMDSNGIDLRNCVYV